MCMWLVALVQRTQCNAYTAASRIDGLVAYLLLAQLLRRMSCAYLATPRMHVSCSAARTSRTV